MFTVYNVIKCTLLQYVLLFIIPGYLRMVTLLKHYILLNLLRYKIIQLPSDIWMLSKAARMYDEVPIPAKPAPDETSTEANCFPSSRNAAFPP